MEISLSPQSIQEFCDQDGLRLDPNFLIDIEALRYRDHLLPLQINDGRLLVAVPAGQPPSHEQAESICTVWQNGRNVRRFLGLDLIEVPQSLYRGALWRYFGEHRPGNAPPQVRAAATTFAVRAVEPGSQPYPEVRLWEHCESISGGLMGVSDFFTPVIATERGGSNQLLNAVYLAFCDHRPLVLSPDMIWVTLLQGLSAHFELHAERLRSLVVRHQGKERLNIARPDFVLDSLENPWEEVFEAFCQEMRAHLQPQMCDLSAMRFSTTGGTEQAAFAVAMMDICKVYFEYSMNCVCGIPSISLEGTVEDWRRMREAVESWRRLDLDWWIDPLDEVLKEFEEAAAGQVNLRFWNDIYQRHDPLEEDYGGPMEQFSGWIGRLFPYYGDEPNPLVIGESDEPILAMGVRSSLSRASVLLSTSEGSGELEFVAGILGVQQLQPDLALRPKIGWVVHEPPPDYRDDDNLDERKMRIRRFRPEIRRHLSGG